MAVPTKANVTRPLSQGYDVLIEYGDQDSESLYLRAAVGPGRQMTFQTVEPEQKGPSTVENPEDMRSESGMTFSRSDFTGGAGLRFAHRRDGTDADWSRFYDSKGVVVGPDAVGQSAPIRLTRSVSTISTSNGWMGRFTLLAAVDGSTGTSFTSRLFYAQPGGVVGRSDDPLASTISFDSEDSDAGESHMFTPFGSLAVLNEQLYESYEDDGIHRRTDLTATETWEHWSDLACDRLWAVKGRILADARSGGLYEAAGGAGSTLVVAVEDKHHFTSVVDAGAVILAACTNGTIYHLAEEDGELVLVGETRFEGETPYSLAAVSGVVLIGTQAPGRFISAGPGPGRLWRAVVTGQRLTGMQLLRQWGEDSATIEHRPGAMLATSDSIYVGVREAAAEIGIWRYVLSTGALYRHLSYAPPTPTSGLDRTPSDIEVVGGRLFVAHSGDDLVREDTTYVSSGYLILPLADFYNDETKVWTDVRMRLGAMPAGTSVTLEYSTDPDAIDNPSHSSWATAIDGADTSGEHEANLVDVEGRWLALKVTLETSNTANTPEVLSVAARALLKPTETDYQIPVNVSDRLERPHRKPLLIPGLGEQVRESMLGLVGKSATVTLLRPGEKVVGQIVGVSEPIQEIPERGSPSVYALLRVRGERQTS